MSHEAVKICPNCGNQLTLDYENEQAVCNECGHTRGGASFWQ